MFLDRTCIHCIIITKRVSKQGACAAFTGAKGQFVILFELQILEFQRMKNQETLPRRRHEKRTNVKKSGAETQ
jgi:hypothetical protein